MLIKKMKKTAGYKLPENSRKWNGEVLKYLFEQNEWMDVDNYFLRWGSAFDGDKGYGTGAVILSKGDKSISVPVIVKDFELDPMDIFFSDKQFRPLTERSVSQALTNTNLAERLVKKTDAPESLMKNIFPPRWGKYVYASAETDMICRSLYLEDDDKEVLASRIKEVAADLAGNEEAIQYVNEILHKDNPEELERSKAPITSATLETDPKKGYKVSFMTDGEYGEFCGSYIKMLDFLKEKMGYVKEDVDTILQEVDNGIVTIGTREKVAAKTDVSAEHITDDAWITTKTKSGKTITGQVIPRTFNFEFGRYLPNKLIVSENREVLAFNDTIVGVNHGQRFQSLFTGRRHFIARPGMVVSFAWKDGERSIVSATEPAKIINLEEIRGEGTLYHLITAFGGRVRVMVVDGMKKPSFNTDNEYEAVYLPSDAVLLSVDQVLPPLIDKAKDFEDGDEVVVSNDRNSKNLAFRSKNFKKVAAPNEMRLFMMDLGLDFKDADETIKIAQRLGHTKFRAVFPEELEEQIKIASLDQFDQLISEIRTIGQNHNLLKIASETEEVDTLDKVLSLNLVNRRNLVVFFKMLPKFKEVVSNLAHLLITSRMGKTGVDTHTISDAMQSLQELVEKMEGFQTN